MARVALTGGIATGKSFCLVEFARRGAEVVDADVLAREVVAPGSPGLRDIAEAFGAAVLRADGALDRAALGRLVFHDPGARARLEAIVHPLVYRRINEWFAGLGEEPRVAIADIPLLFETGRERDFAQVIVCACDAAEQVRRVVARDGLSDAEARARIAAQWPIDEKTRRADYVISTDKTLADTAAQVRDVYERLVADCRSRNAGAD